MRHYQVQASRGMRLTVDAIELYQGDLRLICFLLSAVIGACGPMTTLMASTTCVSHGAF